MSIEPGTKKGVFRYGVGRHKNTFTRSMKHLLAKNSVGYFGILFVCLEGGFT